MHWKSRKISLIKPSSKVSMQPQLWLHHYASPPFKKIKKSDENPIIFHISLSNWLMKDNLFKKKSPSYIWSEKEEKKEKKYPYINEPMSCMLDDDQPTSPGMVCKMVKRCNMTSLYGELHAGLACNWIKFLWVYFVCFVFFVGRLVFNEIV